jgi:hypothetical protein
MLSYGRIITEEIYQNGTVVGNIVKTEDSLRIHSLQELWDNLIQQVARLESEDSISFTIEADHHTRKPIRIILNTQRLIK